jgi:hypothetical protein
MGMNRRSLWIVLLGVINILIGLYSLITFFIVFLMMVLGGIVSETNFVGFWDWFSRFIILRLGFSIFYIFSCLLFLSGIAMFAKKPYSRKLAMVSSMGMCVGGLIFMLPAISSYVKNFSLGSPWDPFYAGVLIYTFLLVILFSSQRAKEQFNDEDVKLSFKWIIRAIFFPFIFPIILYVPVFLAKFFVKF